MVRDLEVRDMGKAKWSTPSSPQSLEIKLPQFTKTREKDWGKEYLSLVEEEQVREHLNTLDILHPAGSDSLCMSAERTGPCPCEASLEYL